MVKYFSYFDFLLDKSGKLLNNYFEEEVQDPQPLMLCKQLIEKSIEIATTSANNQTVTENELKVYEAQRIWHPLSLALVICAHLNWDLDMLQSCIPLHLQQIIMEELLKDYNISQIPKPEDYDINNLESNVAMSHIIYNRWIIRNITKYEELKERDEFPSNLNSTVREQKIAQENHIIEKVKGYRNLAIDILEKSLSLNRSLLIPYPQPRVVKGTTIKTHAELKNAESADMVTDQEEIMKIPKILERNKEISHDICIAKICFDLGCYYFSKELYQDALRVSQKGLVLMKSIKSNCNEINLQKLFGYYQACCVILGVPIDHDFMPNVQDSSLDDCLRRKDFNRIAVILKEDILKGKVTQSQRSRIEKELNNELSDDEILKICTLNFILSCLECQPSTASIYHALNFCTESQIAKFIKECYECYSQLQKESMRKKLKLGVKFAIQQLNEKHMTYVKNLEFAQVFIDEKHLNIEKKVAKKEKKQAHSIVENELEMASDERISAAVSLRADLVSCYDPDAIKEILFQLHDLPNEQSHAKGYESLVYEEIFNEIPDFLMYDTVLVCVTKANQLVKLKQPQRALKVLNICVETLDSFSMRAGQGCSVARVKNVLHHELLWTELKIPFDDGDNANKQETLRRCKACLKYKQQDPPPQQHIYRAIVTYLMNCKEFKFLMETDPNIDVTVVDYLQLGINMSSLLSSINKGTEALKTCSRGLWQAMLYISCKNLPGMGTVTLDKKSTPIQTTRMRTQTEDHHIWNNKCLLSREDIISFILQIKDENLMLLIISCFSSILQLSKERENEFVFKDSYSEIWPNDCDGMTIDRNSLLDVLHRICEHCLSLFPRNTWWLNKIAEVFVVCGDDWKAMECYLESGAIATLFFSTPVPNSVWNNQVYQNMILCCQRQQFFTQAITLCQFHEPVDYGSVYQFFNEEVCDDAMESFYDCLWNINLLEYVIAIHDRKGETEKRKLGTKITGQLDLNIRGSPDMCTQSETFRKIKFLRTLSQLNWKM